MNPREAKGIVSDVLGKIKRHEVDLEKGCVACHVILTLKLRSGRSEQDASDLLSEVLTQDPVLNSDFIDIVEQIHMKERRMGAEFVARERQSKDRYLETYFSNVLDELSSDLHLSSYHVILRKLLLSFLALYLAQTIGVDYHAATEELYYLLRKDDAKNSKITRLVGKFEEKIRQNASNSYSH